MSNKIEYPAANRKIDRADHHRLIDELNQIIKQSDLSQDRLSYIDNRINEFEANLDRTLLKFSDNKNASEKQFSETKTILDELISKMEGFYARIIEIVGIFIAIFVVIIAGIQISFKVEGSFNEVLLKSTAVFIPIIVSIVILLFLIKWIIKR